MEEPSALLDALCREHGPYVRELLRRRMDVVEESRKDLEQRVLLVLCAHVREHGEPAHLRGFLAGVVRNEVRNHRRAFRPDVEPGADADAEAASVPSPEHCAEEAERRARLDRYVRALSEEEAEVIRCIAGRGATIDEAAELLGRARGTVATQLARAREKLEAQARESDRREELGRRGTRG